MAAAHCLGAELTLVANGEARATIVVPPNPSAGHQFAAQELADHVRLATGAELPVVEEGSRTEGSPIYVGDTAAGRRRADGPEWEALPADSFEVHIAANGVILHGRNPLAHLYAVYDFLEQEAGVRWLTPAANGTVVARRETLAVQEATRIGRPASRLRMFFVRSDETALWALRNRVNGLFPAEWAEKVDGDLAYLPPGIGAGTNAGGEWNPVGRFTPSGKEAWQEVLFEIPPELYEPGVGRQIVGFGGADSQVWIADVSAEGLE